MLKFLMEYHNISELLLLTFIFIVVWYLALKVTGKRKLKLPPGPIGLPVLGYLPFLSKTPHLEMTRLASKYGSVFSMRLGCNLFVVLNKSKIIREAFNKPEFLGRPPQHVFTFIENFESPFFSSGRKWQDQRRFAMHTMRDLGFGRSIMEKHIVDEIQCFLEEIAKSNGTPLNFLKKLTPSISNNICSLVFGRRYKYDDPRRIFLDELVKSLTNTTHQLTTHEFFPWLKNLHFAGKMSEIRALGKRVEDFKTFVREHIDQHEKTLDPHNIRDYIDGYLIEMKARLQKDPETVFSRNMLIGSVFNFFNAGTETTRTTIDWSLYTMAAYHHVQKKVQAEIDEIIGKERMPSWQDQKEMPFTQAVLSEIHRWKTIAPIGLPRCTLADTELQGYHIPKGTEVIANIHSAHHDPDEWESPHEFRPDRFLSKDGKSVVKPDSYMPFSTGRRSCPGEILALIEVFLYFTSILQRFTVEIPEGHAVDFTGMLGLTYHLIPHSLCFKKCL